MKALVTGAAGFIGSHLTERLLSDGWDVRGIDSFSDYYDRAIKQRNLQHSSGRDAFEFVPDDLLRVDAAKLLDGVDIVFHLAGQPGVRGSWGEDFRTHVERNVMVTQRLLEASRDRALRKFVFASSSSVYGNLTEFPTSERSQLLPVSPYGVSKLSAEKLCFAYGQTFGIPVMAMRYFTVYGPRQRPDMAFNRFITWIREGREISLYGDGSQQRDFTYVADAVEATFQAGVRDAAGEAVNVGGGNSVTVLSVLNTLSEILEKPLLIRNEPPQAGDVRVTCADISLAQRLLGYSPSVSLQDGLRAQADYQITLVGAGDSP